MSYVHEMQTFYSPFSTNLGSTNSACKGESQMSDMHEI